MPGSSMSDEFVFPLFHFEKNIDMPIDIQLMNQGIETRREVLIDKELEFSAKSGQQKTLSF